MSSKHFMEQIYLYTELSPGEKQLVDEHILQCESCRQCLAEFKASQTLLQRAAGSKAEPRNATRLTSNIMEAVQSNALKPRIQMSWLDNVIVRYGMMACSVVLVLVFVVQEILTTTVSDRNTSVSTNTEAVEVSDVLNTGAMLRAMRDHYLNKGETKSWYACIKEGECDPQTIKRIKSSHALYATH